jgi:hypothetical protein
MPDVRKSSFKNDQANFISIDGCSPIFSSQPRQDDGISKQRVAVSVSDALDYQLHGWTEGTSTLSVLVDPFAQDWADWKADS